MDEAFKKQAFEWFERGRRDLETARLLYDKRGYADYIAYHIQLTIQGLTPKLCSVRSFKLLKGKHSDSDRVQG